MGKNVFFFFKFLLMNKLYIPGYGILVLHAYFVTKFSPNLSSKPPEVTPSWNLKMGVELFVFGVLYEIQRAIWLECKVFMIFFLERQLKSFKDLTQVSLQRLYVIKQIADEDFKSFHVKQIVTM